MGNELTRFNRVRYTLYGATFTSLVIPEPKGWNDDEKELLRSDKYWGIMTNLSNNLEFYKTAFRAIKGEYDVNGIKAIVRLEKEERNELTDIWELSYTGYLDFRTYQQEKNFIKIKFNESEFFKNIESRLKEPYELERLDDLKGGVLPPLVYKDLTLAGRDIFRETYFDNDDTIIKVKYKGTSSFDALVDFAVPLNLKYRSDENFFAPAVAVDSAGYLNLPSAQIARGLFGVFYNAGTVFYLKDHLPKTININIHLKFRAKFNSPENNDNAYCRVFLDKPTKDVDAGSDYYARESLAGAQTLLLQILGPTSVPDTSEIYKGIPSNVWKEFTVNYNTNITLADVDNLGLRFQPFFSPNPYNRTNVWEFEFSEIEVRAGENDLGKTTACKTLTYYQAFERLFWIITGKNTFSSNLLSTKWRDLLLTNGFKIRQFTDKNITISLEDLYNSLNSIDDICLKIKNNTVSIEEKAEAFDRTVAIDLGEVSKITRKIEEKLHYSTIEIGSDFDGVYEEVNGLDEPNIKSTYSTCIDVTDNKLSAISKVRNDSYGPSLAQEKLVADFPKLDTKYDKINFAIDAKQLPDGTYLVRHWADDFPQAPDGIFSPQTAFNLRLSPFNSLKRKSKTISTGLLKYPLELLKYSSTEGNSQLVTYILNTAMVIVAQPERATVQNRDLLQPYFLPETITFNKKITMLQFKTIVNNQYKLIKFVNELGKDEYAFIYPSVKPNKEGKFTLIKANV